MIHSLFAYEDLREKLHFVEELITFFLWVLKLRVPTVTEIFTAE